MNERMFNDTSTIGSQTNYIYIKVEKDVAPCNGLLDQSLMVDLLSFLIPARLHYWCNKGHGMCCLWDGAYKRILAANWRAAHVAAVAVGFHYLSGPLNIRCYITINKMC